MNKGQGLALGAIIVAGLVLRPAGFPICLSQQAGLSRGNTSPLTLPGLTNAGGEGPWFASCNYWAPMRSHEWLSDNARVLDTIDAQGSGLDLHLQLQKTSGEADLACPNEPKKRWGLPDNLDLPDVTAIIATVPDPGRANLAMDFDRTVDALLQAAQDNRYVGAYYWLPWNNSRASIVGDSDGNTEPGHDPARDREPGLIILRHVPDEKSVTLKESYGKVVYVFLVAESPTLGIDGFQFQRAFAYEDDLKSALSGHGFSRGRSGAAAIIGPQYSGSAASLRAGIESAGHHFGVAAFEAAGTTATLLAAQLLTPSGTAGQPKITYYSFDANSQYYESVLEARLGAANYDLQRTCPAGRGRHFLRSGIC